MNRNYISPIKRIETICKWLTICIYDIWPINWTKSFSIVLRKFYDYVDKHVYSTNEATLIRDLCIKLDSGDFSFFNIDELNEMVVLLCTA